MDLALIERSLDLQQEHRLFDIEDPRHDRIRLGGFSETVGESRPTGWSWG
jgi:hypothetical protein